MDDSIKNLPNSLECLKLDLVFENFGFNHGFFQKFLNGQTLPFGINELKFKVFPGEKSKLMISGISSKGNLRGMVCLNETEHSNWFAGEMMGVRLDESIEFGFLFLNMGTKESFGEMFFLPESYYSKCGFSEDQVNTSIEILMKQIQQRNGTKESETPKHRIKWDLNSNESSLKQLSRRMVDYQYRDRPLIPLHAIPKRIYKFNDSTEGGLIKCIQQFIKMNGGIAERINSMGRQIDNRKTVTDPISGAKKVIGSIEWVRGTSTLGTADVSITVFGLSIKVEIKIGHDRQSDAQREYQRRIEAAGGIYIIAKSFDGFLHEFLKAVEGQME